MDPQATFQLILDACAAKKWREAFQATEDLFGWLKGGGFPPRVPAQTYISLGNGGPTAFNILSNPGKAGTFPGANFIAYKFDPARGQLWNHYTVTTAREQP